jgi:hypothetical protein
MHAHGETHLAGHTKSRTCADGPMDYFTRAVDSVFLQEVQLAHSTWHRE